jgi:hypothetical protein
VARQLEALLHNRYCARDEGIALAFLFCTPEFRRRNGPLSRFTAMIHAPPCAALLQACEAELELLDREDDQARLLTRLSLEDEPDPVVFEWELRCQRGGKHDACWMTQSIERRD